MKHGLANETRKVVALCPGAVGPGKRWPEANYAELARRLNGEGIAVWLLGGPGEQEIARVITGDGKFARDLTGDDLRNAILALAAADAAVSNDSGLLHVVADQRLALGAAQSDCCDDRSAVARRKPRRDQAHDRGYSGRAGIQGDDESVMRA